MIDDYLIPYVNWDGKRMTEKIEAHCYVDKTSAAEGKTACELQIWIDSLAVKYLDQHQVRCIRPDTGAVFFRLDFRHSDYALRLERDQNGDCDEEFLFIAGNEDDSLTMVTGREFSWDNPSPFGGGRIAGHKGQIFSANRYGKLSPQMRDTVVAPVPRQR